MKTIFKPNETGTLIVPPKIQSMMSGVQTVFHVHPRYRLNYVDGSHEDAVLTDKEKGAEFFALVSAVQSKRTA